MHKFHTVSDTENSVQVLPCLNTSFICFLSFIKDLQGAMYQLIEQNESFTYTVCEYWYFFVTHSLSLVLVPTNTCSDHLWAQHMGAGNTSSNVPLCHVKS